MDYTSKDIITLEEIEHIRNNPSMYIGHTENPTHLVYEVLDNALDEMLNGYANSIGVFITQNKENSSCTVVDTGRGIPIDKDIPIIISTKMFSGGKHKNIKTAYKKHAGRHGIGLVAVNALSETYELQIYRDNKNIIYKFKDAVLDNIAESKIKNGEKIPYSTRITFTPDKSRFEAIEFDLDSIRKRLKIASAELDKTFALSINGNSEIIRMTREEYFNNYCLRNKEENITDIIKVTSSNKDDEFSAMFAWCTDGQITENILSSVNLLPVIGGGVHVGIFKNIVKDVLLPQARKINKNIIPSDLYCGLRAFLSLSLVEPEFTGQEKYKLANKKEYFNKISKNMKIQIENALKDTILEKIIEHVDFYRRKQDAKRVKSDGSTKTRSIASSTRLKDCSDANGELFIVEGKSAAGPLISSRDPKKHAIFPLRGKPPSVANKKDILSNEEIKELMASIGTGVEPTFNIDACRYNKIIILADADSDGNHISVLLLMMFSKLTPQLILSEKIYLCETPLYGHSNGAKFTPIWDEKELSKFRAEKKQVTRFKGLGEYNPWQIKQVAFDPTHRKLVKIKGTKKIKSYLKLLSSSNEKRKLVEGKWKEK